MALLAKFDGDFACGSQTYTGTGILRCKGDESAKWAKADIDDPGSLSPIAIL
jgi:hypothetical protein